VLVYVLVLESLPTLCGLRDFLAAPQESNVNVAVPNKKEAKRAQKNKRPEPSKNQKAVALTDHSLHSLNGHKKPTYIITITSTMASVDPDNTWIYHELQESLLCGQHAVNNLAQGPRFTASALANIAHQLDEMELAVFAQNNEGGRNSKDYRARVAEGSQHVNASGYFSLEVLLAAVQNEFGVTLVHSSQSTQDFATQQGFLCHKSDHWFAIRNIGGRFWNLNSMKERPTVISHFEVATSIEKWKNEGYTVYCIANGLPESGTKPKGASSNTNTKANWHRMSDLLVGKSTQKDPWENLNGAGMRLDGRGTSSNSGSSGPATAMQVEGLTEDEMLQMALQASMEPTQSPSYLQRVVTASVEVPPEPAAGSTGAVRIQFKMDNKRTVRRFLATDSVEVVYAFMEQQAGSKAVELLFGFPPKNLSTRRSMTIGEAQLANESIQGRLL